MYSEDYASFVVRIWRNQAEGEQAGRWCGEVEQIQSGARWCFCTLTELLTFLQQAASIPNTTMPPSTDQAFHTDAVTRHP
jgi:hypothetical protein